MCAYTRSAFQPSCGRREQCRRSFSVFRSDSESRAMLPSAWGCMAGRNGGAKHILFKHDKHTFRLTYWRRVFHRRILYRPQLAEKITYMPTATVHNFTEALMFTRRGQEISATRKAEHKAPRLVKMTRCHDGVWRVLVQAAGFKSGGFTGTWTDQAEYVINPKQHGFPR